MLSAQEEAYILKNAKVPEHIPALMAGISRGEPFLAGPFLFLAEEDWLIFVGYPLEGDFSAESFSLFLEKTLATRRPARAWFIAPQTPGALLSKVRDREEDSYFRLDLPGPRISGRLIRAAQKAAETLTITVSRSFGEEHQTLTGEFLQRQPLPPRVHQLYLRMKDYLSFSATSLLLSARNRDDRLSAYYVLEAGAEDFLVYVVGCYSKTHYVPHASDFLFYEMIRTAEKHRKAYIHLGLGVNEGIARFKKKWGGVPFLRYESGEIPAAEKAPLSWFRALVSRL
jgi:hypothetical protein